jgi:hypothetical protein
MSELKQLTNLGLLLAKNEEQSAFDYGNINLAKYDLPLRQQNLKGRAVLDLWDCYDKLEAIKNETEIRKTGQR